MSSQGAVLCKQEAAEPLTREETILKYMPLVRSIAGRVRENLPVHVELDDLVHAGVLGLFDAVDKFNPDKNVVFHLYAKHRVRGAILDSLRQLDWASRDLRRRYRSIEGAAHAQAQKLGRAPNEAEIAEELGLSEPELQRRKRELHSAGLGPGQAHRVEQPSYSGALETAESDGRLPDEMLASHELRAALNQAVATLPPRYQTVIKLYYARERTMKEIGAELGVNESRVSQIHKSALEKLGAALRTNGYHGAAAFVPGMRVAS